MIGVDTNLLLYALNRDASEHQVARSFLDAHAGDTAFVLSELVLVELYVLLRNAAVVGRPLDPAAAVGIVDAFRRHPAWQLVDHDPRVMDDVWEQARRAPFARTRIFDIRLALGLVRHGVTRFATRNVRHFEGLGFDEVWDPLAVR